MRSVGKAEVRAAVQANTNAVRLFEHRIIVLIQGQVYAAALSQPAQVQRWRWRAIRILLNEHERLL